MKKPQDPRPPALPDSSHAFPSGVADLHSASLALAADRKLEDFLLERGWMTADRLKEVLERRLATGGTLGTCLLEAGAISEDRLLEALSQIESAPACTAADLAKAPINAQRILPTKVALRTRAVPFRIVGGELWVAMEAVSDLSALDEIAAVTGRRLRPHVTSELRLAEAIEKQYGLPMSERLKTLLDRLSLAPAPRLKSGGPLSAARSHSKSSPPPPPAEATSSSSLAAAKGKDGVATSLPLQTLDASTLSSFLGQAPDRESIADLLIEALAPHFDRALLFKLQPNGVAAWRGRGKNLDSARFDRFVITFDQPSVFLNLNQGAGIFLGALPGMEAHESLVALWGGELSWEALVLPLRVGKRMVAALYLDRGASTMAAIDLPSLLRLAAAGAEALGQVLVRRKQSHSSVGSPVR